MEKYIFDEKNGLWYELNGDYYLPCLTVPEDEQPIGVWGQRHLRYISRYQKVRHTTLLLTGKLNSYLVEIDARAVQMLDLLVTQMAAKEGITERLKATDQMTWVQRMNNIRNAAEEIVNAEVIFV
ncbi:MAG: TnpV protein [Oscillospiraceae bacterium]|nr:TnpV protein [Oscillospiraceae bacterium]